MKTIYFCWLLSFGLLANTSAASAPPEQESLSTSEQIEDAATQRALRDATRAQLSAEAAAETAKMVVQAVAKMESAMSPPSSRMLPRWHAQAQRLRLDLDRASAQQRPGLLAQVEREHDALRESLQAWTVGVKRHAAAVDDLGKHVADAEEAATKAAMAAREAIRAHGELAALHGTSQRELLVATQRARAARGRLQAAKRRSRRAGAPGRRHGGAGHEGAKSAGDGRALDEMLEEQQAAQEAVDQAQAHLASATALEAQRRGALEAALGALQLTRKAEAAASRDAARVGKRCKGGSLRNAKRVQEELDRQRGELVAELNTLRAAIVKHQDGAITDRPATVVNTEGGLVALQPVHDGPDRKSPQVALIGDVERQAAPEPPRPQVRRVDGTASAAVRPMGAGVSLPPRAASAVLLPHAQLSRAAKPAGQLLKGGVAGGEFDKAFQRVPELLAAVHAHDPSFQIGDVPVSARNRLFWLADGRQILLINACRSEACNQRTYTIAYDRMGGKAAFVRRTGEQRFELFGRPDEDLKTLLLWFARREVLN